MKLKSVRFTAILGTGLLLTGLAGCKPTDTIPESALVCKEPRTHMCTRDYRPACGFSSSTDAKTYSNACTACTHSKVKWVVEGSCQ